MDDAPARTSSLRILLWMVVFLIAALIVLQATGIAEVVSRQETEELIERPHDAY